MSVTFNSYKALINAIENSKFNLYLNYRDIQLKFKNVTNSGVGTNKLFIYGLVPNPPDFSVSSNLSEYLIYTEEKTSNLEVWEFRLPFIAGAYDISTISPYHIDAGYTYTGVDDLKNLVITENVNRDEFSFTSPTYIPINTSEMLKQFVSDSLAAYGKHPGIQLYPKTDNPERTKIYHLIPIGVVRYKVMLEAPNGESITKYFDAYDLYNPTVSNTTTTGTGNSGNASFPMPDETHRNALLAQLQLSSPPYNLNVVLQEGDPAPIIQQTGMVYDQSIAPGRSINQGDSVTLYYYSEYDVEEPTPGDTGGSGGGSGGSGGGGGSGGSGGGGIHGQ